MYVPAKRLSFTVAEALEAMGRAMHPDPCPTSPVMIREARKVPLGANPIRAHSLPLDEADWDTLRLIWSMLDAPSFPMPESAWKIYAEAFEASRNRPTGWTLTAIQRDPELQTELRRAFSDDALRRDLQAKVGNGTIRVLNPLTGDAADLLWRADQDDWLLSRQQLKALCNSRSIGFVDAPGSKAPDNVPAVGAPGDEHYSVVGIACEAARLRHPLPDEGRAEARTLVYGWRDWTEQALQRQANGYAYDRKIRIFPAGGSTVAIQDPFSIPQDQWQVDAQGRDKLLDLFRDDPAEIRPTFDMPARPTAVPAALALLPENMSVCVRSAWRQLSEWCGPASSAIEAYADAIARQADGWFQPDEVAQLLHEAGRGAARSWREKLEAAAQSDQLATHEPGSLERVVYASTARSPQPRKARSYYEWVHLDDVNRWLDVHEPRLPFRFENPSQASDSLPEELLDEDGVLGIFRRSRPTPNERLDVRADQTSGRLFSRDGWIGHSTARRRFDGTAWDYEDPENQSFAIDLLLHGQSLVVVDAFIERLEAEGALAGAELRNRRLDAWENRGNREIFKRHVEWILVRKREIETAEKSTAEIGRLQASLEARTVEGSRQATDTQLVVRSPSIVAAQSEATTSTRPTQAQPAQEAAILAKLAEMGYQATALPKGESGRPGVKAAIKGAIGTTQLFPSSTVFDKAWQRLRGSRSIVDADRE